MTTLYISGGETMTTVENELEQEWLEFQRFVNTNMVKDSRISSQTIRKYGNYTDEQVHKFLEHPRAYERELRQVSRYLENTSQIYKRIVNN